MTPADDLKSQPGRRVLVHGYTRSNGRKVWLRSPHLATVISGGPDGIRAEVEGEERLIPAHLVEVAQIQEPPRILERVRLFRAASDHKVQRVE